MIWSLVYNLILLPLFIASIFILGIFNGKIRKGIFGRIRSRKLINDFANKAKNNDIYWFHAASLGEYEQIKPILTGLKEVEPEAFFVISFFSPSGFDYVEDNDVDCKIYLSGEGGKNYLELDKFETAGIKVIFEKNNQKCRLVN